MPAIRANAERCPPLRAMYFKRSRSEVIAMFWIAGPAAGSRRSVEATGLALRPTSVRALKQAFKTVCNLVASLKLDGFNPSSWMRCIFVGTVRPELTAIGEPTEGKLAAGQVQFLLAATDAPSGSAHDIRGFTYSVIPSELAASVALHSADAARHLNA